MPGDLPLVVETESAVLRRREWETSTFDFATLGASHKLRFSWHLLDVFLNACHLEIEIKDAADYPSAQERIRVLQVMLYLKRVPPFIIPVGMTHTLRDYSGINHRDSPSRRAKLPEGLQSGFVSADGTIEGWLHEPTFKSFTVGETRVLSAQSTISPSPSAMAQRCRSIMNRASPSFSSTPMN